jgi:hypothetical protein
VVEHQRLAEPVQPELRSVVHSASGEGILAGEAVDIQDVSLYLAPCAWKRRRLSRAQ